MPKLRYKKQHRRKGHKVYKTNFKHKNQNKHSQSGAYIKALVTIIGVVALVFVGYSIGKPIKNYVEKRRLIKEETVSSLNEGSESVVKEQTTTTTATTVETTTVKVTAKLDTNHFKAKLLDYTCLSDVETLRNTLSEIKADGINAAIIDIKNENGRLTYNSSISYYDEGISSLTLEEICKEFTAQDITPVARLSVLKDGNFRATDEGFYRYSDGSVIYDDYGQLWLSPFDSFTDDLITDILDEIVNSGFKVVICKDINYPDFDDSVFMDLGDVASTGNRNMILTGIANKIYRHLNNKQIIMMLEINEDLSVYQPDELLCKNYIIDGDYTANSGCCYLSFDDDMVEGEYCAE